MVDTKKFLNLLIKNKINFFSGVPDSCTSQLCNLLNSNKKIKNFVAPNEGHAVSLGILKSSIKWQNTLYLFTKLWIR